VAFTGFMAKGEALIFSQAVRAHGGNTLGPQVQPEIDAFLPEWNVGKESYNSCLAEANAGAAGSSILKVSAKVPPGLAATVTDLNRWIPVSWDLETEVPAAQMQQWPAVLSIETRFAVNAGTVIGFEFRNPTLRLKATGRNIEVAGLKILVNDELQNLITTFLGFRTVVAVTTNFPLAQGTSAGLGWRPGSLETDNISLEIQRIAFSTEPGTVHNPGGGTIGGPAPLPTRVTFEQLISNDPDLGVFRAECMACHGATAPSAGLNLGDYAQASLQSSQDVIRLRAITQGNMPPPPRALTQRQKDIINIWLTGGAPRN
jgi:hypothetical protein